MKISSRLALVAVLCAMACGTYDAATSMGEAKAPAPEAFGCAIATLNSLGYTITDASKDAGFIKAERKRSGGQAFLTGHTDTDRISVSVFEDPTSKKPMMRISGETIASQEMGRTAGSVVSQQTTADVKGHVQQLLSACGK